eukprot:scaffold8112_cov136-Isochrysis_galbana.AAC.5
MARALGVPALAAGGASPMARGDGKKNEWRYLRCPSYVHPRLARNQPTHAMRSRFVGSTACGTVAESNKRSVPAAGDMSR